MEKLSEMVHALLGIKLTQDQIAALRIYERELLSWNEHISLTAIRDEKEVWVKHFLDSLTCLMAWDRHNPPGRLIDVGTGAGFPGLVLKLVWPASEVILVESVGKKANFCQHVVDELGLTGVTVLNERAEAIGQMSEHRQSYDLAVARAVARMPILMEYLLPLVHHNGIVLAMKGESAPSETQIAEKAIQLLGGKLKKLIPVVLPGVVDERFLVVVDKVARTPAAYPRRIGLPAKNPIF